MQPNQPSIGIKNYFLFERIPLQLRYITASKYSLLGFHRSNITIVNDRADVDLSGETIRN
jgi:maltodextrin utilization protein YvdJ